MRARQVLVVLLPTLAYLGCGSPAETPPASVDATSSLDSSTDAGGGTDITAPPDSGGPECTVDADCADKFPNLGPCEIAQCTGGECTRDFAVEGGACDDGDPCNGAEVCGDAGCEPGEPLVCADEDPCNGQESCDPDSGGCRPGKPLACPQDDDLCNGPELCSAGSGCASAGALDCDDGNPCTKDSCDPTAGCIHEVDPGAAGCCEQDSDCDDGNSCTEAVCNDQGSCEVTDVDGPCTSPDPCSGAGVCKSGVCETTPTVGCAMLCQLSGQAGDVVDCALDLARLGQSSPAADTLGFSLGYQAGVAAVQTLLDPFCVGETCVNAAIPQSASSLLPSGHTAGLTPASPLAWHGEIAVGLSHPTEPDTTLNDAFYADDLLTGDARLFVVRFELLADTAGSPVVLHDPTAGAKGAALTIKLIGHTLVTTDAPCGADICLDLKTCTDDVCDAGVCNYGPLTGACEDGNPCTVGDACDAAGDCAPGGYADAGATCTGDNLCLPAGTCDGAGTCNQGVAGEMACEDPGPCLTATCDPMTGACVTSPLPDAPCDDGSVCTEADRCDGAGTCAGTPIDCGDVWGCTIDTCDAQTGCEHTPDDGPCTDKNACTTDTCSADTGCVFANTTASCDDGDSCTAGDVCADGICAGAPMPTCGCDTDADCAPLEDGDLCNGTLSCQSGQCLVTAATVVTCPADGFECQQDWTCAPATGECTGVPLDCGDGVDCTTDTCSLTDGCLHKQEFGCPIGTICELSGAKDDVVLCAINLARGEQGGPIPSGGDFKLHWDPTLLRLDNFQDSQCIGAVCFDYDLAACVDDSCTFQKLFPSGHDVLPVPKNPADWTDSVSLLVFHAGEAGKPITDAYVSGPGVTGDATFLTARFTLLKAVDAASPAAVEASQVSFNPSDGLPMSITIQEFGQTRVFVATPE